MQDPERFVKEEWADIAQEAYVTVGENYNIWQKSQLGGFNFNPDAFFLSLRCRRVVKRKHATRRKEFEFFEFRLSNKLSDLRGGDKVMFNICCLPSH